VGGGTCAMAERQRWRSSAVSPFKRGVPVYIHVYTFMCIYVHMSAVLPLKRGGPVYIHGCIYIHMYDIYISAILPSKRAFLYMYMYIHIFVYVCIRSLAVGRSGPVFTHVYTYIRMYIYRPRSFLETGFRPLCPSFVEFVPLSRTKPAFWITTRKPIFSEPGSILVDGFDTRLIPRSFSCGVSQSCR